MMKRFILLVVCLLVIPAGCAHKKPEITGVTNLPITPIMTPTSFHFGPFQKRSLRTELYSTQITSSLNKSSLLIFESEVEAKNAQNDGGLIWNMDIKKIRIGNKSLHSGVPLVRANLYSDKLGNVNNVELSSPALAREGKTIESYAKFKDLFQEQLASSVNTLRDKKIVSGEILFFLNSLFLSKLNIFLSDDLVPGPRLLGYSYIDDKKVVVAELNLPDIPITIDDLDLPDTSIATDEKHNVQLSLKAYYVFDEETMLQLDGELVCHVRDMVTGEKIKIEIKNSIL